MWWLPPEFSKKRPFLATRQAVIRAMRGFFDAQGFAEVDTPILQVCPVIDTHIRAFATDQRGVDGQVFRTLYLHTSPEFAMKKLMVGGMTHLYQICHVFRNGEESARHSPEFTMIEWYRANADYTHIMADCVGLLRACAAGAKISKLKHRGAVCDPFADAEYITVQGAFEHYADIDLQAFLDDKDAFRAEIIAKTGLHTADDDNWDDLFFRVMGEKIEPFLGMKRPTFLCDYPIAMASLSKPREDDPRFAERFELYVCGIELANAFSELTDPVEQRRRYHVEMDAKEKLYGERYPLDEEFIAALERGLPPSGGIALGVDRLVMLCSGAEDIDQVLWCGRP